MLIAEKDKQGPDLVIPVWVRPELEPDVDEGDKVDQKLTKFVHLSWSTMQLTLILINNVAFSQCHHNLTKCSQICAMVDPIDPKGSIFINSVINSLFINFQGSVNPT